MKSRGGREALKRNKTKMAVACASRFAVLKIEDDDEPVAAKKQQLRTNSKPIATQNGDRKKAKKKRTVDDKDTTASELQSLAFATNNKSKKKHSLSSKVVQSNKKSGNPEQWEEWKKKDKEFVNDSYEQDLKQALLMSRLDFEEKKEFYPQSPPKSPEKNGKISKKTKEKKAAKKKEKPSTLSLGEFNNLLPSQIENLSAKDAKLEIVIETAQPSQPPMESAEDIWNDVAADTKDIIHKEKSRKMAPNHALAARSLQFQDEIEKREKEIESLSQEVELLKNELQTVKVRNKKLCNILGQGEMREKAEILIQVDQLTRVKDELTQEISELHQALEQEKSKVHSLQTELKKYQVI
uniref:G kinase-anchoring protein 1 n=1 Tax=Strigamia maritima TaxID=126957 RepID=T1JDZ6_STRMM